jgi:hypothetical protein
LLRSSIAVLSLLLDVLLPVCVYTGSNGNLRLDQQTLSTSSEGGENSEGDWAISRGHLTLMVPAADGRTGGGRSRRSLSIYSHARAGGTTIDRRSFLPPKEKVSLDYY